MILMVTITIWAVLKQYILENMVQVILFTKSCILSRSYSYIQTGMVTIPHFFASLTKSALSATLKNLHLVRNTLPYDCHSKHVMITIPVFQYSLSSSPKPLPARSWGSGATFCPKLEVTSSSPQNKTGKTSMWTDVHVQMVSIIFSDCSILPNFITFLKYIFLTRDSC